VDAVQSAAIMGPRVISEGDIRHVIGADAFPLSVIAGLDPAIHFDDPTLLPPWAAADECRPTPTGVKPEDDR
jgi:hypothetical protein